MANTHGVEVSFTTCLEEDLEKMIRPGKTKLVWVETPSNPTLGLVDLRKVATIAQSQGVSLVVDNTFCSPYIQNPLSHGADIVVHSVTKYINGHSVSVELDLNEREMSINLNYWQDVIMGVAAFNCPQWNERLTFLQNAIGAVPSAFDCWLAHRGLKTLHLRSQAATKNATAIALALEASDNVICVRYPGIGSHPQRDIAVRQHRDGMGGGMLSFRLKGGREAAHAFCQNTKIFTLAESLGGIESLCEVPAGMTHAGISKEEREESGVYDDLVRLSCGIEDTQDLIIDVLHAIKKAVMSTGNGIL